MASKSRQKYLDSAQRSDGLRVVGTSLRGGIHISKRRDLYHACLTLHASCWNTYIKDIVNEFLDKTYTIASSTQREFCDIARMNAKQKLEKFNTPNFENSRNILLNCINFDPLSSWHWEPHFPSHVLVQQRLNEILKVRHAFAHGHTPPTYSWAPIRSGVLALTSKSLIEIHSFFKKLVLLTDNGIAQKLKEDHHISVHW